MRIRSITCFLHSGWPVDRQALAIASRFLQTARQTFTTAGYEVQSVRLATTPFSSLLSPANLDEAVHFAQSLEQNAADYSIDFVSVGPALPEVPDSYAVIPEILGATQNVFASGAMTTDSGEISLPAIRACAQVITRCANLSQDGFSNLRFTALANVPAGSPFFPAAYHRGKQIAFAIATEAADLAIEAFTLAPSLDAARHSLVASVNRHAEIIKRVALSLSQQSHLEFQGIDFTLAPFPQEQRSFGTALERVGVEAVGLSGSLAAAAILADTLDRAQFPRVGFSGLMFPVMEDSTLGKRAEQGLLTVNDLLLYSAVCGSGLDTLPLPGDATPEQLSAVLIDLASLATRLDKPLTARLMPIPGKKAGDPTGFDFSYFANSRILSLKAAPLQGFLAGNETFRLRPRAKRGEA